jgi:hypothetical protein
MFTRKVKTLLIGLLVIASLAGCGLRKEHGPLQVSSVPAYDIPMLQAARASNLKLVVGDFRDVRADSSLVLDEDREAADDVADLVTRTIRQTLRENGVHTKLFGGPKIDGEIQRWQVVIEKGFPSRTAKAEAEISLSLKDEKGNPIFRGRYSAESELEHPLVRQHLDEILGQALGLAIKEALNDDDFVAIISGFRSSEG